MNHLSETWIVPNLLAHRGASAQAPENTLAALRRAKTLGATWVEFDVMLDSRGEAIIFHDHKLHRTTNGHGFVAKTPYSVIATLDAGSWFGREFKDERVPTLADWLQEAATLGLGINLEMKLGKLQRVDLLADQVLTHLARYWRSGSLMPLISSASVDCLAAVHERAPHLMFGYITNRWNENWRKIMRRFDCVSLHIDEKCLTKDRVSLIKSAGYRVLSFTVHDARRAFELFDMGVDGVFANDPLLLK
jgi:glycerophosphoryl diester phosphodiesterase